MRKKERNWIIKNIERLIEAEKYGEWSIQQRTALLKQIRTLIEYEDVIMETRGHKSLENNEIRQVKGG